jgi:hypothetical protein
MANHAWVGIAHKLLHMASVKIGQESWWCVNARSTIGDTVFIYKPGEGIVSCFRILEFTTPDKFCASFAMATAKIKVLRLFQPPISLKRLKEISGAREETFVRRNCQGTSFLIKNETVIQSILQLK